MIALPTGYTEDEIIALALGVMDYRCRYGTQSLSSPATARDFFRLRLADLEHEEFHVAFCDSQNRLIATETMFRGTLTQTSVYPREVVKAALRHNAAGVFLAHNHPSGNPDASPADRMLTSALRNALSLVDVCILDHIIVAGKHTRSFAETGLL